MAKILYSQKGSDAATITWPETGPPSQRYTFTSGTAVVIHDLIGYGDGTVTYADGRAFPPITRQGSTVVHQKG